VQGQLGELVEDDDALAQEALLEQFAVARKDAEGCLGYVVLVDALWRVDTERRQTVHVVANLGSYFP